MFPQVIAAIIADYAKVPKLLPWIDANRKATCKNNFGYDALVRNSPCLWANPLAYEAGLLNMAEMHNNLEYIAKNPAFAEYIKNNFDLFKCYDGIWQNEMLCDLLVEKNIKYYGSGKYRNNNKKYIFEHIHLLKHFVGYAGVDYSDFLSLPNAWPYFADKVTFDCQIKFNSISENCESLLANPCAIELIKKRVEYVMTNCEFWNLSRNPHPWAIEYCRQSARTINIYNFAQNPGIFTYEDGGELERHLMRL